MDLWKSLLYRGVEYEDDILKHPDYLEAAYQAGKELAEALRAVAPAAPGA
jgi:hypothetical protein